MEGSTSSAPTSNPTLLAWVKECATRLKPDRIYWCNGSGIDDYNNFLILTLQSFFSEQEKEALIKEAVDAGVLIKLNQDKLPGCYLHRSNPSDVARVEHLTFICTPTKEGAGPTNNWMDPKEAYEKVGSLFEGAMQGKTMYVIPYVMGPVGSPFAKIGFEITDSIYVVLNMRIMTRMGDVALKMLGNSNDFNRGVHSVRDCHPDRRYICHFPQDNTIWSVGSGYGGNALLGKKCLSLRIGSYLGKTEGWLAEHMLVMGVENPYGQISYFGAAFPSQCGKTNFAMLTPPRRFRNWKIWTVGDDLAWLRTGEDGRLWAINPENGYFGVAPGTNLLSNPNAMACIQKDTIYTNVALTEDLDVWWEGKTEKLPEGKIWDWQGRPWTPGSSEKAAHPNSRFTAPAVNNPWLSPHFNDPQGVPISAIIFGGRRATTVPLVIQSFNWTHGVFMGATLGSETTAAATGAVGILRRDPMAMLPFCGYNMGEYWGHWLHMQSKISHPPKIFMVNWFRKDKQGKYLWPGFGENMRVLKWILDRSLGAVGGQETQMGWVPQEGYLDLSGLNLSPDQVDEACRVDLEDWRKELVSVDEWFKGIGSKLPPALELTRQLLLATIDAAERQQSDVEIATKKQGK